jgi:hypothetical protein
LGPVKVVANAELRSMFAHFTVFKQRIGVGSDAFLDVGRIWSDYTFRSPLDGQGLGIKYGAGGGMYWMWGQAAIFRIEVAYSPDANAENRGIPIGVYVEDGPPIDEGRRFPGTPPRRDRRSRASRGRSLNVACSRSGAG